MTRKREANFTQLELHLNNEKTHLRQDLNKRIKCLVRIRNGVYLLNDHIQIDNIFNLLYP